MAVSKWVADCSELYKALIRISEQPEDYKAQNGFKDLWVSEYCERVLLNVNNLDIDIQSSGGNRPCLQLGVGKGDKTITVATDRILFEGPWIAEFLKIQTSALTLYETLLKKDQIEKLETHKSGKEETMKKLKDLWES